MDVRVYNHKLVSGKKGRKKKEEKRRTEVNFGLGEDIVVIVAVGPEIEVQVVQIVVPQAGLRAPEAEDAVPLPLQDAVVVREAIVEVDGRLGPLVGVVETLAVEVDAVDELERGAKAVAFAGVEKAPLADGAGLGCVDGGDGLRGGGRGHGGRRDADGG